MTRPEYEIYGLQLASATRPAAANFLHPAERSGTMRMDFITWLIRGHDRLILVDTGFSRKQGDIRNRYLDRTPAEALRALGLHPRDIDTVIITHLHYDHAGNVNEFPDARLVIQAEELEYATGPAMVHPGLNHFFATDDICHLINRVHGGNIDIPQGELTVAPGVRVHLMGGHTRGLQIVEVATRRGPVILASDALHYFENFAQENPFPAFVDLERLLAGYRDVAKLAPRATHIIPGHDPLVFTNFPSLLADFPVAAVHEGPLREFTG